MTTPLLFLDIGGGEILLIFVVVLVFFGPGKIPELARGLGKGIREFKDASNEIRSEFERVATPPPPAAAPDPAPLPAAPAAPDSYAPHGAHTAPTGLPIAEDPAPAAVALPAGPAETAEPPLPPPPVVVAGGVPGTRARGTQLPTPTDPLTP